MRKTLSKRKRRLLPEKEKRRLNMIDQVEYEIGLAQGYLKDAIKLWKSCDFVETEALLTHSISQLHNSIIRSVLGMKNLMDYKCEFLRDKP